MTIFIKGYLVRFLYDIAGSINSVMVFISLYGIFLQLKTVWLRKLNQHTLATELLSVNQFSVSFFAYFSFFVYGFSVEPFNHYMVWPRLTACCLVLLIIREIYLDRKSSLAGGLLLISCSCLVLGIVGLALGQTIQDEGQVISTILILVVSAILAQGNWHQIQLIYRSGQTGAVNIKMSQFILAMDISTLFLAFTMGVEKSWPMVVLALVSGVAKVIIMGLFRWVKLSPNAAAKRLMWA